MRIIWASFGFLALCFGTVGIVLPLVPTVPFLLLAAFCFAQSSPYLHHWLMNHAVLGPPIADWQSHGAIRRPAKKAATLSIALVFGLSLVLGVAWHVLAIQAAVLSLVLLLEPWLQFSLRLVFHPRKLQSFVRRLLWKILQILLVFLLCFVVIGLKRYNDAAEWRTGVAGAESGGRPSPLSGRPSPLPGRATPPSSLRLWTQRPRPKVRRRCGDMPRPWRLR